MIESFKKNKIGIILMIGSSLCVCIGQLLWKLSLTSQFYLLILGFIFYGIGALVMVIAYRFGSLSVLQPMLSLNYVISIILAHYILDETVNFLKILGIIIIILGVLMIGGGDN